MIDIYFYLCLCIGQTTGTMTEVGVALPVDREGLDKAGLTEICT